MKCEGFEEVKDKKRIVNESFRKMEGLKNGGRVNEE